MSNFIATTADEKSRESIINDIDENIFVEAGAGSGKTTMLVNRMIAMIEDGKKVDKICAITFTKNAALEFYERFQRKLIERSNKDIPYAGKKHAGDLPEPTEESRIRCKEALENIDLCFMGTIDSFCNMILSEHPAEAGIPSDAVLIDDDAASKIYKQFYLDVKDGKYGPELKKMGKRFAQLFWGSEDVFANLISRIMDRRNIEFIYTDELCKDFDECFKKQYTDLKKVMKAFAKDSTKVTLELKKNEERSMEEVFADANSVLQKTWINNYTGVQNALKLIAELKYDSTFEEMGFTDECVVRENAGKIVLNIADINSVDSLVSKMKNYKYQNTLKFLLACIEPLEKLMRENGKFTYFDYLYYLREMLHKDTENGGKLIDYIYSRHSYFLIDEFQDTNPLQAEVFFYLASENPVPYWRNCKPRPGSLFIVGDPKQSIYRFRSADVASYISIRELFEKGAGKVCYLDNNFRSRSVMKNYFNEVFEEVMNEASVDQSVYRDIENLNPDSKSELEGIYKYEVYTKGLLGENPEMADEKRLSKIVRTLVGKHQVVDRYTGELRPVRFEDFMIIFFGKKKIAPVISQFKKDGIPTKVEGKVLFEECEGLKLISNVYKVVTDSTDILSLFALLSGPLFGHNESEIAAYITGGHRLKIEFNRNYEDEGIEKSLKKIANTAGSISAHTPSSLFEKIMDDFRIFEYVSSENLEVVYYSLELIRSEEINGNIVTFEDAVTYMNNLLSGESELERCLSLKQGVDAVHLANLHKVKGLEAPIVILSNSSPSAFDPELRIEYENDDAGETTKAKGYIIEFQEFSDKSPIPYSLIENVRYKPKDKSEVTVSTKEKNSLTKETDRLVYVAATRARNALIIAEPKQRNGKTGLPSNRATGWKDLKNKANDDFFEVYGGGDEWRETPKEKVDASEVYNQTQTVSVSKAKSYEFVTPSTLKSESRLKENPIESQEKADEKTADGETYSTLIGTMVHRMMEMIILSKNSLEKNCMIDNIISEYLEPEFEDKKDEFLDKLSDVYDTLKNGGFDQYNGAEKDILKVIMEADETYPEVPFTYRDGNEIWNGIIDFIYRKNGKLHIIDWKTNRTAEGLDKHYEKQLNAYKKAVENLTGEKIEDALIYHIDINGK